MQTATIDREIVATAPGAVALVACDAPEPRHGELLVETLCSAISPGTELAWIDGAPGTPRSYPWRPGYSAVGRVVGRGPGTAGPPDGTMVAFSGAHRARQIAPADRVHALPGDADPAAWSPYLLASIALHGVRLGGVRLGDAVAIVGLGPIGLCAAQLARAAGATAVVGIDPVGARRALALRLGCTAVAPDARSAPGDARVVVEATGRPAAVGDALGLAGFGGTVVLLGSTRGIVEAVDVYGRVHKPNVTVVGAHAQGRPERPARFQAVSMHEDEACACALAAQRRLDLAALVSRSWRPEDAVGAYAALRSSPESIVTAVFDWR